MCDNFKSTSMDKSGFICQVLELQGHKVLAVSGEIDVYTAPQFKQSIIGVLAGDEQHLIMDMQKVTYIDSTGLTTLVSAVKRLSPNGGTVNLVGCSANIKRLLLITKVSNFVALHQNTEDALKAISA